MGRKTSTSVFIEAVGEPLEYLLVCSIIEHLIEDNWDWDNIHRYRDCITVTSNTLVDLALFQRTVYLLKILTVSYSIKMGSFSSAEHGS